MLYRRTPNPSILKLLHDRLVQTIAEVANRGLLSVENNRLFVVGDLSLFRKRYSEIFRDIQNMNATLTNLPWALCRYGSSCNTPTSSPTTRRGSTRGRHRWGRSVPTRNKESKKEEKPRREYPIPQWRSDQSYLTRISRACTHDCLRWYQSNHRRWHHIEW